MRHALSLLLSLLGFFAVTAEGQTNPDILVTVQTTGSLGSPYGTSTLAPSTWNQSYSASFGSVTQTATFSGSSGTGSVSMTATSSQAGSNPLTGGVAATRDAQYRAKVYVKGGGSVSISSTTSGTASGTSTASDARYASFGPAPFGTASAEVTLPAGSSSDSDSVSVSDTKLVNLACSPTGGTTFSGYPGSTYFLVEDRTFTASTTIPSDATYSGTTGATGTVTISATRGGTAPSAILHSPEKDSADALGIGYVSSGVAFTVSNDSYDSDDGGTTPLLGICTAVWVITDPDSSTTTISSASNSSALSGISFTPGKTGPWQVQLTVTDNEGVSQTSTLPFQVNEPWTPLPDEEPACTGDQSGGGGSGSATGNGPGRGPLDQAKKQCSIGLNPGSGNVGVTCRDPVHTRGYPLKNNLTISSQTGIPERTTVFGNASFSYGIEVRTRVEGSSTVYYLIDGDGTEFKFGTSLTAPSRVHSTLSAVTGGYELTNAGAPGRVEEAGNFSYTFNSAGKLTAISDPAGNDQTVAYDGSGYPTEVEDVETGRVIGFEYDSAGIVARVVENGGAAVTHLTYSGGRISQVLLKNSAGATIQRTDLTYNGDGLVSSIKHDNDSASVITASYTKASPGVFLGDLSWAGGGTRMKYHEPPLSGYTYRNRRRNAQGQDTYFDLDASVLVKRITAPTLNGASGATVLTFTYGSDRQPLTMSDGLVTHAMTYGTNGRLTKVEDNVGNYTQYTYSGADLTGVSDNDGTVASYAFTDSSHPHTPTEFTDGGGNTWTATLNSHGQTTQVDPPSGSVVGSTYFTYDEGSTSPTRGYLTSITNGAGDVVTYDSYDDLGNLTSVTTSPGSSVTNTTTFTYDASQRLTEIEHPDGKTVQATYVGRFLNTETDEAGADVSYSHCPTCGKVTGVSEPLTRSLSWDLNGDHQVTKFTDPRAKESIYTYGNAGEVKQLTFPDAKYVKYQYYSDRRLKKIEWNVSSTTLSYDSAGRLSSYPIGTNSNSYEYFSDGRLKKAISWIDTVNFAYDSARRIQTVTYNGWQFPTPTQTVEYAYNPDGTVDSVVWKNNGSAIGSWDYTYDGAGRITGIDTSWGDSVDYAYDGEGKVTSQANSNGTSTTYAYNEARNWVTSITHKKGATTFDSFALEYDGTSNTVGNLTKVTELSGDYVTYGYDALYRLTSEVRTGTGSYSKSWGYDLSGNITTLNGSSWATYDDANKISTISGGSVSNHANGNLDEASGTGVPYRHFRWNEINQPWTYDGGGSSWNYSYDALGRRTRRHNSVKTDYTFDKDGNLIGEVANATPSVIYVWGPTGIAMERLLDGTPRTRWYHFGPQGETRYLTNGSGNVSSSYRYSAYGVTLSTTGSDYNPFRYGGSVGYYTDTLIGEILATYRWYDPYLMRWLSRDPIGYEGGVNQYEYVGGRPTVRIDPTGHEAATGFVAAGGDIVGGLGEGVAAAGAEGVALAGPGIAGVAAAGVGAWIYCQLDPESCEAALEGYICSTDGEPDPSEREISIRAQKERQKCHDQVQNDIVAGMSPLAANAKKEKCLKRVQDKFFPLNTPRFNPNGR